jgi:hypothetical protein
LATISSKPPAPSSFQTGNSGTPVAAIATCVPRHAASHASNARRLAVGVANVRQSRVPLRPTTNRTQATTVALSPSRPASRWSITSMASPPHRRRRCEGLRPNQVEPACTGASCPWPRWGSSRLLGSNAPSASPAPWNADLVPTASPADQTSRAKVSFMAGRPKAGAELAMTLPGVASKVFSGRL